jgi:hypothetical protein
LKFQPGQSGNPQGRPKGSKDKRTASRAKVAKVVHDYLSGHALAADLVELSPKERIAAVTRLLPYVLAPQRHEDGPDVAVEQMVAKLLEHANV